MLSLKMHIPASVHGARQETRKSAAVNALSVHNVIATPFPLNQPELLGEWLTPAQGGICGGEPALVHLTTETRRKASGQVFVMAWPASLA